MGYLYLFLILLYPDQNLRVHVTLMVIVNSKAQYFACTRILAEFPSQPVIIVVTFRCVFADSLSEVVIGDSLKKTIPFDSIQYQKHTHTHPFNGPFSGTTRVSRYHKGITNLDFNEARDRQWQWHQLGHMQVCT